MDDLTVQSKGKGHEERISNLELALIKIPARLWDAVKEINERLDKLNNRFEGLGRYRQLDKEAYDEFRDEVWHKFGELEKRLDKLDAWQNVVDKRVDDHHEEMERVAGRVVDLGATNGSLAVRVGALEAKNMANDKEPEPEPAPCMYCHGEETWIHRNEVGYWVECDDCHARGPTCESALVCTEQWNGLGGNRE